MTKWFSKSFKTYSNWLIQSKKTPYTARIGRLHGLYPKATLSQLRGHPRGYQRALSLVKPKPIFRRTFSQLTQRESSKRMVSFDVLSEVRRGKGSLSHISRLHHTTPETVIKHTNAFKKDGNRWKSKRFDKIERKMKIIENGEEITISINDSRYASIIGKYHSAIKDFLDTGDESYLKPFENVQIKDSYGNWHTLDTNPDNIYDVHERREDEEFYTIYSE